MFSVTPDRILLGPKEAVTFTITLAPTKAGHLEEQLVLSMQPSGEAHAAAPGQAVALKLPT
jgi:hypothetical protein